MHNRSKCILISFLQAEFSTFIGRIKVKISAIGGNTKIRQYYLLAILLNCYFCIEFTLSDKRNM